MEATRKQCGIQRILMSAHRKHSAECSQAEPRQREVSVGHLEIAFGSSNISQKKPWILEEFQAEWTIHRKIHEENNAPRVKKGDKRGGNTGSFPRPAPARMDTPGVSTACSCHTCLSPTAELLPVCPSAETRPKNLKATLLLQSWWPAGRLKCSKSACRAALLGCFSLAEPPFLQDM